MQDVSVNLKVPVKTFHCLKSTLPELSLKFLKTFSRNVRNMHKYMLELLWIVDYLDLLYLTITSINLFSSIVIFFQNFVQYWYTSNVIQL